MGIYKVKDRRGRRRYVVSKYWPHGSGRLRMYAPNYRSAQALQTRIESSILDGTWKQLKQELAGGKRTIWTVHSFYQRFLEEYCKPRMRSWRSYEGSFKSLNAMLGKIPLKEFQRKDLHRYVAQRKKQVKPATVNRAIAAISKLFSYALECGEIDTHPLVRFPKLKEPKKVFRPLTVRQFRDLVEAVENPYLQAMIAVIGETGIRKGEALSLTWKRVDLSRRLLWVELTKNDETREIPLSQYATGYLSGLPRYLHTPIRVRQQPDGDEMGRSRQAAASRCRAGGVEGRISRSKTIPVQPLADAGGGREDGAEADGAFGHQHDDALRGVRQFACARKHSRGRGYRRLTNATGNKQATGWKEGGAIRGGN